MKDELTEKELFLLQRKDHGTEKNWTNYKAK